jgi:diguanylate cyclase (GGDEF)-like protein
MLAGDADGQGMEEQAGWAVDPRRIEREGFVSTLERQRDISLPGALTSIVVVVTMLWSGGTSVTVMALWAIQSAALGVWHHFVAGLLLRRSQHAGQETTVDWRLFDVSAGLLGCSIGAVPLLVPITPDQINPMWFATLVYCAACLAGNILMGNGRLRCFVLISAPVIVLVAISGLLIGGIANLFAAGGTAFVATLAMQSVRSGEWFTAATRMRLENERLVDTLIATNAELFAQTETDPLTGLANRLSLGRFAERVDPSRSLGVICLDLDGFKSVNDEYGHAVGDAVIAATASRLRRGFPEADLLVRLGGDEFLIVIGEIDMASLTTIGTRVRAALEQPLDLELESGPYHPRTSVGVCIAKNVGEMDAAITAADRSMYRDKAARKPEPVLEPVTTR